MSFPVPFFSQAHLICSSARKEKALTTEELIDSYEDESETDDPLDPFFAEGLITNVIRTERSGKEGTVFCCEAGASTGFDLLAVKLYRPRQQRNFKNDAVYRAGRPILNGHDARAVKKKTDWGREYAFAVWIGHEFATLQALKELGADVPTPLKQTSNAILMEFIGDRESAAPMLSQVRLELAEARHVFERLLFNIEEMLAHNYVHGDLSAYNVLYWEGRATMIDFPQTVDPRLNTHAFDLFSRDVDRVCRYFSRYGILSDPARIARYHWGRFLRSEL
jgi:RIO kinase 1